MPIGQINGINLSYEEYGSGEPVLLIPGTGAPGRVFRTYQVPALTRAGFRAITMDNRGVPPTDVCAEGFTLADMVADTAGLIEHLGAGPCRVIGYSMGAIITQELLLARPDLVGQAVLMATRGRTDPLSAAIVAAEIEAFDNGLKLPAGYEAYMRVMQGFSRRTLSDEQLVRDWLDIFEISPISTSLSRSQLEIDAIPDRLANYRTIKAECLVLAFQDDLLARPYLCREVADSILHGRYQEIPGCGHYGFIEEPAAVNAAILDFFRAAEK